MNLSPCTACGHSVSENSTYCEQCGASIAKNSPKLLHQTTKSLIGWVTTFFASQATLCLFTLLVFLGLVVALAPAGWRYANLQLNSEKSTNVLSSDSRSLGGLNTPARCNQILVIFNASASVGRISALLEQLDTTIAFGPNENSAFELSMPASSAAGVMDALNRRSDLVVSASLQRRCL